jgi:hypothetical protein
MDCVGRSGTTWLSRQLVETDAVASETTFELGQVEPLQIRDCSTSKLFSFSSVTLPTPGRRPQARAIETRPPLRAVSQRVRRVFSSQRQFWRGICWARHLSMPSTEALCESARESCAPPTLPCAGGFFSPRHRDRASSLGEPLGAIARLKNLLPIDEGLPIGKFRSTESRMLPQN